MNETALLERQTSRKKNDKEAAIVDDSRREIMIDMNLSILKRFVACWQHLLQRRWKCQLSDFDIVQSLGEGSFSEVIQVSLYDNIMHRKKDKS